MRHPNDSITESIFVFVVLAVWTKFHEAKVRATLLRGPRASSHGLFHLHHYSFCSSFLSCLQPVFVPAYENLVSGTPLSPPLEAYLPTPGRVYYPSCGLLEYFHHRVLTTLFMVRSFPVFLLNCPSLQSCDCGVLITQQRGDTQFSYESN